MKENKQNTNFKSGVITLLARTNAGKSTLLNQILGQKIAVATPLVQTTRKNLKGIYTDSNSQIIITDTPGIHKPKNELGEYLSTQAKEAINDVDLILYMIDCTKSATKGDIWLYENYLKDIKTPILVVYNKVDLIKDLEKRELNIFSYKKIFNQNLDSVKISAKTGRNVKDLIEKIKTYLKDDKKYFDDDTITDSNMREISSELIREAIIINTKDELPHHSTVVVEEYHEKENIDKIKAKIIVNTESQKGIIIGKNGEMLKKIGTKARLEIEKITQKKVYLELFVKVQKNWLNDKNKIKALGFD